MRRAEIALLALLAGCGPQAGAAQGGAAPIAAAPIAAALDCLRAQGRGLASAHRGGPGPGLPENALETLAAGFAAGVRLFEVDVRRTKDGVLVLLHDETLERTTTGSGSLRSHSLQELAGVRLKDDAGALTQGRLPTLADALTWAVKRGAYLQLDIKPEVRFEDVVAAVWQARAADSVILIVYSTQAASRLARLAPDMTISAPAETAQDLTALQNAGVGLGRLAAWTGLTEKTAADYATLRGQGVEPILGTLGRPGLRLDDRYAADGDVSEYAARVKDGVAILASDSAATVAKALDAADRGPGACLVVAPQ